MAPAVERWSPAASDTELYEVADVAGHDDAYVAELEAFVAAWTPEMHQAYEAPARSQ